MTQAPKALLTVSEVARLLHVSDDTVRRQIKEGALKAIRVRTTPTGRAQYRIPVQAVQQVLGNTARALHEEADVFEPLREAFAHLTDEEREGLTDRAVRWARERRPLDDRPRASALTREELEQRQTPLGKQLLDRVRNGS